MLELNEDVRRPGTPWTEDDGPWPDQFFVIGDDQCGNYWCVALTGSGERVYFYNHDTGAFEAAFPSVAEFAAALLAEVEEWNREWRSHE